MKKEYKLFEIKLTDRFFYAYKNPFGISIQIVFVNFSA